MDFWIRLAEKNILIHSRYDFLQNYCRDYVIEAPETADLEVFLSEADIEAERNYEDVAAFTPEYLETVAALRKISEQIPLQKAILCHGAVISYQDAGAFLFTAPSGTGKSTHIGLWKKYLGDDVCVINGDKPFLYADTFGRVFACGSPWAGKEGWQSNASARLKGICLLKRGTVNQIKRLMPIEAVDVLLSQMYIPSGVQAAKKALDFMELVLLQVPVYEMTCDISEDAVKCSFEELLSKPYHRN